MRTRTPIRPRLETLEDRSTPAVFIVTNTDNDGAGSLRQAIDDANNAANSGGPDEIHFNIPGAGVHTIRPDFSLPGIDDSVVIDGYTQPGSSPNTLAVGNNAVLLVEINGANAGETTGLVVFAPDTTIRGLVVNGFRKGSSSTAGRGIAVLGQSATNVSIVGNFSGVNAAGNAAVPNENIGIFVLDTSDVRIGGPAPADRNVVSGNGIRGIFANATGVVIQGNYVGTNAAGSAAVPNTFDGVFVAKNSGYRIGGAAAGEGNLISGNGFTGITLNGVTDSFVQGNRIGVAVDGTTPMGNGNAGLFISNQAATNINNLIGGPVASAGNTIAFSATNGILVQDPLATGNRFQNNRIFGSGVLGIDLSNGFPPDGVTANDAGDTDTGANGLQNFPVITSAINDGGTTTVLGTLNSTPNTAFTIEVFTNAVAGASGFGDGETPFGSVVVTTDAEGNAEFSVFGAGSVGDVMTATATDNAADNTSEFSAAVQTTESTTDLAVTIDDGLTEVESGKPLSYTITLTNNGSGTVTEATMIATLPPSLTGVVFTPSAGSYDSATGEWSGLNLAPGDSVTLTAAGTLAISASGELAATVAAFAPAPLQDPDAANNVDSDATTIHNKSDLFAIASGPGISSTVEVFNADGTIRFILHPYGTFTGGAAVGTGDLTGDGIDDIVTGSGPGGSPHVKVFDGANGQEIASFFAYDGELRSGVFVGLGDVTGDHRADIVAGAGPGGAAHVKVFDGASGAEVRSFLAFDSNFRGGVTVRAGDVDADGFADIVTGAGPGAGPHVKVFSGKDGSLLQSFFAGDPSFTGGVFVGVANLSGDTRFELITSVNGKVSTWGSASNLLPYIEQDNFTPFGKGIATGTAAIRLTDGIIAILIGAAPGGGSSRVRIIDGTSNTRFDFLAFDPAFTGGVFVG